MRPEAGAEGSQDEFGEALRVAPPVPEASPVTASLSPFEADFTPEDEPEIAAANGSGGTDVEMLPSSDDGFAKEPVLPGPSVLVPQGLPRLIPHLGHVLLFFAATLLVMGLGQALGLVLLQHSHVLGHRSFQELFRLSSDDARLSLPVQAFSYALVAAVVIPIFSLLWREPFGVGVHWNAGVARRRFLLLGVIGIAAGFGIGAFGNFLPMPKDPPIMQDMMKSPIGAWMMLVFGVAGAPLLEELAFRGFLLPGLINAFRWMARRDAISGFTVRSVGVPFSVLLTSAGFAFLHSPQVSHAWGPLVLIGTVSVVLCIVRLAMDSVMAGVVVHAAYNLTLFAGVLVQTGGFRHLEKLTT